jgi:hypothetical protein
MPIGVCLLIAGALATASPNVSFYPLRLEDPRAVYVTRGQVHADGIGDDTAALQKAIDKVQETTGQGIVFLPEGRYRITKTLAVWPGIRVIGYGSKRPILVLGKNTPGFQDAERFMVFFAGRRPSEAWEVPAAPGPIGSDFGMPNEANPGTFYSGMSNIDIEIQEGNASAVAIRGRYAQHCLLAHMDFNLGSAYAGIHDTGNIGEDLRFFGGQYGLVTRTPSPGWQFTLMDSSFQGQARAAIRTHETGLTLIRPRFKDVPVAISVDPDHTEQLWMSDAILENVSEAGIETSREHALRLQLNAENVFCRGVPTFAKFRESGRKLESKEETYRVSVFSHGLQYQGLGSSPQVATTYETAPLQQLPDSIASDSFPLPAMSSWVNVASFGAKGDGIADDTAAIKTAVEKHRAIYLPTGKYRVTETIRLKPETVLIGLNPITTQIIINDGTPAFMGVAEPSAQGSRGPRRVAFAGNAVPLLETPAGGTNIVSGIGLDTGGNNPAAVAALWMAGSRSMMDDVKFVGGHGSNAGQIYNANNSGDPNPERRWDSQYPSLWVRDGGGGTFKNLWTASPFAQSGMTVSDTQTEGRVYQMSSEHHVRYEMQLRNVANWQLHALQTEEERGEGPFCLPLEIENCRNVLITNLNMYRVVSVTQPFPYAVRLANSSDIRFRGVHCYSNSKASFDSLLFDSSHGYELRQREIAVLTVNGKAPKPADYSRVKKLAGGFFNISGGAVDPEGNFAFVDAKWHRIYLWNAGKGQVSTLQDTPLNPVNVCFDRYGNLMVVSYAGRGTVFSFKPGSQSIVQLKAEPATARPDAIAMLPVTDWQLNRELVSSRPQTRPFHFVSPDGSTYLPVTQEFLDGTLTWGVKLHDVIRTFGLAPASPGKPFYAMGESEVRTYSASVLPDGTLVRGKLFAEQGGEGLTVDAKGNVYIAAGSIYVYSPQGKLLDTIEVPERPIQLAFGGKGGKTLFIAARTSLYALQTK